MVHVSTGEPHPNSHLQELLQGLIESLLRESYLLSKKPRLKLKFFLSVVIG